MALFLENLDDVTRAKMKSEVLYDIDRRQLYVSPRLNAAGLERWPDLLIQAVESGNDTSLAEALSQHFLLNEFETRTGKNGTTINARVPVTANITLSRGRV